jgi:hypothetical protein
MNSQSLSALLAAIITFVIGGSVFLRDRRHKPYLTFATLCFTLSFWYLTSFLATTLNSEVLFWLSLMFAVGIPSRTERFLRAFLAEDPRKPTSLNRGLLIGTVLSYLLLIYSGLFFPLHRYHRFTVPLAIFIFGSLYYCVLLIQRRQRTIRSRPEATRLTYLFFGGVAAVTLAATDFLSRTGIAIPPLGNVLTVIYMYFISQTLFHYRLLPRHGRGQLRKHLEFIAQVFGSPITDNFQGNPPLRLRLDQGKIGSHDASADLHGG